MLRARWRSRRGLLETATAAIFERFDAERVEAILLKGPALARALYEPAETRGYYDIDLLVRPADLGAARAALAQLGYEGGPDRPGLDDVAGILNAEVWWQMSEDGPIEVDLHHHLAGCDAPPDVAWAALAACRVEIAVGGRPAPVLDRTGLALHVAMHAAQHGPIALKAMGDLERALASWPPDTWRSAAQLAEQVGATPALSAGLRLSASGTRVATELGLPEAEDLAWAIAHRGERPRGTFHLDALLDARGPRARFDILRRSLWPQPSWITYRYGWAKPGVPRLAAGYAAHLLSAPLWAARALRYRRRASRRA